MWARERLDNGEGARSSSIITPNAQKLAWRLPPELIYVYHYTPTKNNTSEKSAQIKTLQVAVFSQLTALW